MEEILPGIFHWTTFHEVIRAVVHSYYIASARPAVLIDPRVPKQGLKWFAKRPRPEHIYLTNRLHYRHSDRFSKEFGCTVWCHRAGLHAFDAKRPVRAFDHGDSLPGGISALVVGVLCPEETALYWPANGGVLSIDDAIIRDDEALGFVPDELMGDDPAGVKRGLRKVFTKHLAREFDSLLFSHGAPWIGGGKAALAGFLATADQL